MTRQRAALACDLIIASERAIFALPEPRVGIARFRNRLWRGYHHRAEADK